MREGNEIEEGETKEGGERDVLKKAVGFQKKEVEIEGRREETREGWGTNEKELVDLLQKG
jgi:hypothetical protein